MWSMPRGSCVCQPEDWVAVGKQVSTRRSRCLKACRQSQIASCRLSLLASSRLCRLSSGRLGAAPLNGLPLPPRSALGAWVGKNKTISLGWVLYSRVRRIGGFRLALSKAHRICLLGGLENIRKVFFEYSCGLLCHAGELPSRYRESSTSVRNRECGSSRYLPAFEVIQEQRIGLGV